MVLSPTPHQVERIISVFLFHRPREAQWLLSLPQLPSFWEVGVRSGEAYGGVGVGEKGRMGQTVGGRNNAKPTDLCLWGEGLCIPQHTAAPRKFCGATGLIRITLTLSGSDHT